MWSKQADTMTRDNNKNMTSFRNKITNRKRKNSKSRNSTSTTDPNAGIEKSTKSVDDPNLASKNKQKDNDTAPPIVDKKHQSKNNKNRGRNRSKKDTNNKQLNNKICTDTVRVINKNINVNNKIDSEVVNNEDVDVVLRNPANAEVINQKNVNGNTTTAKRYSDSFVIENDIGQMKIKEEDHIQNPPTLTRAVSGFFIIDHARKANRRLSDLFRPSSTLKLSSSVESLKSIDEKNKLIMDKEYLKKNNKELSNKLNKNAINSKLDNSSTKSKKSTSSSTNKTQSPKVNLTKESSAPTKDSSSSNSYLKRVKSKIYKSKNDSVDEVDNASSRKLKPKKSIEINGRIPEETEAVLTPNGLRKSLTHFDFRLPRQTSNLERVRPKTYSAKNSNEDSEKENLVGKPVMEKSKSSSAINLSLWKSRRKIMETMVAKAAGLSGSTQDVQNEFDFIAFGSVNNIARSGFGSQSSLQKQPSWLHIHKEQIEAETKQSHPVSRSGSDRRPDAVREEGLKHQESTGVSESAFHADVAHENFAASTPDSSTILPAVGSTKRTASNINRSESVKEQSEKRKQRRNISDPSHNTTSGDVDLERHPTLSNTDSGSSSNSSISCNGRHSESPSNSIDVVSQATIRTNLDSDSDMDVDAELWQNQVVPEELRNLSPHEKKRQDVINELFHTENSHCRSLKVLYKIFFKKIQDSQTLKSEELSLIFPNIKEIFDIHNEINREMKRKRKEDLLVKDIGDLMLKMFDDKQGEALKKAAAVFCERQQLALEFIKKRRERDSKFDSVLAECEKKRQCRRLPFQGILPTEMQRLSKYPLLLERLIGSIESNKESDERQQEELLKLKRAHYQCKEILNNVNEAAKVAHNKHRLEEIQKHMDTNSFDGRCDSTGMPEFKMLDVTKYKLIIEGGMQLRKANKAIVPVHILLLEEIVVILQRDGDKFLLKYFQSAQSTPLSPIIKLNTLLVRNNAVCRNALFLVNMSTNTMYDLIADDESKREVWSKHFSDAIESFNRREGKSKLKEPFNDDDSDSERVHDLPPANEVAPERAEAVGGEEQPQQQENTATVPSSASKESRTSVDGDNSATKEDQEKQQEEDDPEGREKSDVNSDNRDLETDSPDIMVSGAGGGAESTTKISAEDWPLIQPSQVNVAMPPVHTAESMLTPLEQIKRKDALVKQALEDKEDLVADMLSIPREHFQHIADIMVTADTTTTREPSERVLAAIFQIDQLQKAVNKALNISELDQIALKGGKHPSCASQQQLQETSVDDDDNQQTDVTSVSSSVMANPPLTIQVGVVRDIASSLSSELTTLLSEVRNLEEERERLRKELHKVKEALHEQNNLHSPIYQNIIEDNIADNALTSTPSPSAVESAPEQNSTPLNDSIQIITKSDCEDEEESFVD